MPGQVYGDGERATDARGSALMHGSYRSTLWNVIRDNSRPSCRVNGHIRFTSHMVGLMINFLRVQLTRYVALAIVLSNAAEAYVHVCALVPVYKLLRKKSSVQNWQK